MFPTETKVVLWRNLLHTWLASVAVGLGTALLFFVMALLFSSESVAMPGQGAAAVGKGALHGDDQGLTLMPADGREPVAAPELENDVSMKISGMLARVRVKQRFKNPSGGWAEGIYRFPLPERAAVDRLRLHIGKRVIEGEIQPRELARKQYRQAKRAGRRASLLSQQRPNIFTTSVANIAPGDEVSVEFEYQQELRLERGRFTMRYPMVVAPRYIPGKPLRAEAVKSFTASGWAEDTDQVPDASQITPPVALSGSGTRNPTRLKIELNPGFVPDELTSRYHQVHIEQESGRYRVTLAQDQVASDRDFELTWRPQSGAAPGAALFRERWNDEEYALLMLMPPTTLNDYSGSTAREMIFVLDTSGSMHGESIRQAKAGLRAALQRLQPKDSFNLIRFNQRTQALFHRSVPATPANIRRALDHIASLQAEGGTEMLPAMRRALSAETGEGRLRQVVFLTDGSVANELALFEVIRKQLGSSRLFTIGIGSAPNSHFMRRAAEFGRGTFTYIGSIDEVGQRIDALFRKLESPVLTDVEILSPDQEGIRVYPQRVPDLYLGEPVVVALKWQGDLDRVVLQGRYGATTWEQVVVLNGGSGGAGVHALWARRAIAGLMQQAGASGVDDAVAERIRKLALEHRIVSRFTSLVALDKPVARPQNSPLNSRSIPALLPHGWTAARVPGGLPQTATSAPLRLLIGLFFLTCALLVWGLSVARGGRHVEKV